MSLTIFLALCILSLDFMIYVLIKLFFGDHRSRITRRVAAQRKAAQVEAAGLIFVPQGNPASPEPRESGGSRAPSARSRKPFARGAFHARIAQARRQLR